MPPPKDEPIQHRAPLRPQPEQDDEPARRTLPVLPATLALAGLLIGAAGAYALKPAEVREVEKVVERTVPGPERIVEKPVRVASNVECPTVQTIVQRIVTVEETKPTPKPAPVAEKPKGRLARLPMPREPIMWNDERYGARWATMPQRECLIGNFLCQ